jgi:transposase
MACPQTWLCFKVGHERHERDRLTDAAWAQLAPLLQPQEPRTGRPAKPHRPVVEGILWTLRTGGAWRDLPERFGSWHTVASRFYRCVAAGLWDRVLAVLQRRADAAGALDWRTQYVDGTVIRAHQHAAGARKGTRCCRPVGPADEALGRSRGGFSTKLHLRAEGSGKPMVLVVTAGQRHEQTAFLPLMEAGAVKRPGWAPETHTFSGPRRYSRGALMRWPSGDQPGAGGNVRGLTGPSSSTSRTVAPPHLDRSGPVCRRDRLGGLLHE